MAITASRAICAWGVVAALATAAPAQADVVQQTSLGFVSRNVVVVQGTPAAVWKRLITPATWWSSDHTFSGDAANLTLDPVPGGCFCEKLPGEPDSAGKAGASAAPRGGVEHMRVIFIDRAKAMRLTGALGPLQSEGVSATLTITLKAVDSGTRVIFEYVVGGYLRYPPDKIASAVDAVMGNQLVALAQGFGAGAALIAQPQQAPPPGATAPPETAPAAAPDLPAPTLSGRGLDPNGLLVPHGKVWSLPASGPPPPPLPADPLPVVAPLPTAALPPDNAPTGGARSPKKRSPVKSAATTPVVAPPRATVVSEPIEVAEPPTPSRPATTPSATPPSRKKPAKPSPPVDTEPSKDSLDAAFDAAFGGAPRPPTQ